MSSFKLRDELIIEDDLDFNGLAKYEEIEKRIENFLLTEIYESIDQDLIDRLIEDIVETMNDYLP